MDAAGLQGSGDPYRSAKMSEKEFHDSVAPIPRERGAERPSLAEYLYYAKLQREAESHDKTVIHSKGLSRLFNRDSEKTEKSSEVDSAHSNDTNDQVQLAGLSERELELVNARRALRQAGWATVFYLITCDILGPFNAPYAISQIGMVPGVLLYVLFGAAAAGSGWMLSILFNKLDSHRHPIRTYGDLADRVFGAYGRHVCSILQAVQLILNCGIICLSNGASLSQVAKGNLCFSVCVVIWAILGMIMGMIRSLQNFSILANGSVWLNLLLIFISMGFVANAPPNIVAAQAASAVPLGTGPVVVKAIVGGPLSSQVNGVFNMVFAYGGAMIFPEIMAEMRRPMDFIKGMALAQTLIFVAYVTYGIVMYSLQGQYTLALAYLGVSKYSWQTVGNVIALITGSIAAGLYGNIGLKVVYINIVEGIFKGAPLMSAKGRVIWTFLVFAWWSVAFIVGSCVPSIGPLSGLIAAVAIFHFTYTFPPLLMLGLYMGEDAALADEPFQTPGVRPKRIDSWASPSRWSRGFFTGSWKRVAGKAFCLIFFLAALATDGLGLWATGTVVRGSLSGGTATSLGCGSPA